MDIQTIEVLTDLHSFVEKFIFKAHIRDTEIIASPPNSSGSRDLAACQRCKQIDTCKSNFRAFRTFRMNYFIVHAARGQG